MEVKVNSETIREMDRHIQFVLFLGLVTLKCWNGCDSVNCMWVSF